MNLTMTWHLEDTMHRMPREKQLTQLTVQDNSRKRVANMMVVITAMFWAHYVLNFRLKVFFMWALLEPDSRSSRFMFLVSFISFCLFF